MSLFRRWQAVTNSRPDYRLKLSRDVASPSTIDLAPLPADSTYALVIGSLARHPDAEKVAFQAVVVSTLQMLFTIGQQEQQAADAALSLAQKEKLAHMAQTMQATAEALHQAVRAKGEHMLDLATPAASQSGTATSWWFALSEALEALETGLTWTKTLVSGRPRGSAVRTLGDVIARLLHTHHQVLLEEAAQWLD